MKSILTVEWRIKMVNNYSLYLKSNIEKLKEFNEYTPDSYKKFVKFNKQSLNEGTLSQKIKELTAVAVAHTTGCAYCIDHHVKSLKKLGGTKEELAETIMVATALKAGSSMAHSVNALNAYDGIEDDELYKASYFNRLKEIGKIDSSRFKAFVDFDSEAMKAGFLSTKEKELIAIAVAHTTGCPYCIELHVKSAKQEGVTKEELAEIIMVATILKAGSTISHGVNGFIAYE